MSNVTVSPSGGFLGLIVYKQFTEPLISTSIPRKSLGVLIHHTLNFPSDFGNGTVCRNRLGLMDKDPSEYCTFDSNTLIDENYHKSKVIFEFFMRYGNH